MCLEDLKLGRGRFPDKSVSATANTDGLLPADSRRVAVIVSVVGSTTFDPAGPTLVQDAFTIISGPTTGAGIQITFAAPNPVLVMRIEDWGQFVTNPISVAIANNTGVARITLTPILTEVQAAPAMRDYKP